jgi:transcriptional regulator with GAF, ATPase, and Fis domain
LRTTVDTKRDDRAAGGVPGAARLRVVHPRAAAALIPLGRGAVVLGRNPGDVGGAPPLLDDQVSRRHFAVAWDAARGAHVGRDLGSRNGSFVDGARADDAHPRPLGDGSVVRLGGTVAVYEIADNAAPAPAAPGALAALPGDAPAMLALRARVARAAPDPSNVLITGETGVGKELVAREIHRQSGRAGKLVAVNCAALSAQIVESQLFGHVRGAFTGASEDQAGLFRAADGGTLLLDEVGELPLDLQPKLLRVLQDREVRPVGGQRSVRVDVRVVAATNRDLQQQVARGDFRLDLYARLALWEVAVPPLRARRGDLPGWIDLLHARWLAERARRGGALELDAPAVEALLLHAWPGNLRDVDRLVHELASGDAPRAAQPLGLGALPAWLRAADAPAGAVADEPDREPAPAADAPARRPSPTRDELEAALATFGGSVRAVAKHFGRDRRQIYRWLEAYGLRARDDS